MIIIATVPHRFTLLNPPSEGLKAI
jgi:hypothetical protein